MSLHEAGQRKEVTDSGSTEEVDQVDQMVEVTAQTTADRTAQATTSQEVDQDQAKAMDPVDLEALDHGGQEVVDQDIQATMDQEGPTVRAAVVSMISAKTGAHTPTASEMTTLGTRGTSTCMTP